MRPWWRIARILARRGQCYLYVGVDGLGIRRRVREIARIARCGPRGFRTRAFRFESPMPPWQPIRPPIGSPDSGNLEGYKVSLRALSSCRGHPWAPVICCRRPALVGCVGFVSASVSSRWFRFLRLFFCGGLVWCACFVAVVSFSLFVSLRWFRFLRFCCGGRAFFVFAAFGGYGVGIWGKRGREKVRGRKSARAAKAGGENAGRRERRRVIRYHLTRFI